MAKKTLSQETIKIGFKKPSLAVKKILPKKNAKSSAKTDANINASYIETITLLRDMVDIFASLPDGNRRGIGGDLKLTTKQQKVLEIIQNTQERADQLLELL